MASKIFEIISLLISYVILISGAIQWRKKYLDLKVDYDSLLSEISRLSTENGVLKNNSNTDPV